MADYFITIGDTAPNLKVRLKDKDGTTVTLTGASVKFGMKHAVAGTPSFTNETAVIESATPPVDPDDPNVSYDWATGEGVPTTPGLYNGQFEVTYADTTIQTFPDNGFIKIVVQEQLT